MQFLDARDTSGAIDPTRKGAFPLACSEEVYAIDEDRGRAMKALAQRRLVLGDLLDHDRLRPFAQAAEGFLNPLRRHGAVRTAGNAEDCDDSCHTLTVKAPVQGRVKRNDADAMMRIGNLAERSGVSVKTIRFYDEIGLLPAMERSRSGYRLYGPDALARLRFIRSAQAVGLTLAQIKEVIALRDQGRAPCEHVLSMLEKRADEVERHIAELVGLRDQLRDLYRRGRLLDPSDCRPGGVCDVVAPVAAKRASP